MAVVEGRRMDGEVEVDEGVGVDVVVMKRVMLPAKEDSAAVILGRRVLWLW